MGQNYSAPMNRQVMVADWDPARYEGTWWFVGKTSTMPYDECSTEYMQILTWNAENCKMEFEKRGLKEGEVVPSTISFGQFWPCNENCPGLMKTHYNGWPRYKNTALLWTNYEQWAIFANVDHGVAYLLSRSRKISSGDRCFLSEIMRGVGICPSSMHINDISIDCGGPGSKVICGERQMTTYLPSSAPHRKSHFNPSCVVSDFDPIRYQGDWWYVGKTSCEPWDECSDRYSTNLRWNEETEKMEYETIGFKDGQINPYTLSRGQFFSAKSSSGASSAASSSASCAKEDSDVMNGLFKHHANGWFRYMDTCLLWTNYDQWAIWADLYTGTIFMMSRKPTVSIYDQCNLETLLRSIGVNPDDLLLNNNALDCDSPGIRLSKGAPLMHAPHH